MQKLLCLFRKKYGWAIFMAILLSLSTAYTLLDAFVIPKSYVVVDQPHSMITMDASSLPENLLISQNSAPSAPDTNIEGQILPHPENPQNINSLPSAPDASTSEPIITGSSITDPAMVEPTITESAIIEPIIGEMSYQDENITISIEKVTGDRVTFYVADIQLSDAGYLQTAFAKGTFGKNIIQNTSQIAAENDAIFAVNGDYYGFRDTGLIIRNGVLYRDIPRDEPDRIALTIDRAGNLSVAVEGTDMGEDLIRTGIIQSFSFGPLLVQDSQVVDSQTSVLADLHPRTAIGQIAPLHYLFIVADGRSKTSRGMTLSRLAQEFADRGAAIAYNLDGGGSATMWFNGQVINSPSSGRKTGERSVSDIVYIGY